MGTAENYRESLERRFKERFGAPDHPLVFASAPGRVELAGNHVDHQGGRTIAAALNVKAWGMGACRDDELIVVDMKGFGTAELNLAEPNWTDPRPEEENSSLALIRGMAAACVNNGCMPRGASVVTTSDVPVGCGLSSSAAFEVLLGELLGRLWADPTDANPTTPFESAVELALAAVDVEQRYFGKPCGAQDQLASAVGGAVALDFVTMPPEVTPVPYRAAARGWSLCLIDTKVDHSNLTDDYAAVPLNMTEVARYFGCDRLIEVDENDFMARFPELRKDLGDRLTLRALHFYDEVHRVDIQREAIEAGDFETFMAEAQLSGQSTASFLRTVSGWSHNDERNDQVRVILALCSHLLNRRGAWRIHGGGFGGSILVFVPDGELTKFAAAMNGILGYEACLMVEVSPVGAQAEYVK